MREDVLLYCHVIAGKNLSEVTYFCVKWDLKVNSVNRSVIVM